MPESSTAHSSASVVSTQVTDQLGPITELEENNTTSYVQPFLIQQDSVESAFDWCLMKKAAAQSNKMPLARHRIQPEFRTKMIDWLVEVTTAFKTSERTYYLACGLFDDYLRTTSAILDNSHVHLIGLTALHLASKYEDPIPLSIQLIAERISHGALTRQDMLKMQEKMLRTLDFDLDRSTPFDIFEAMQNNHSLSPRVTELTLYLIR